MRTLENRVEALMEEVLATFPERSEVWDRFEIYGDSSRGFEIRVKHARYTEGPYEGISYTPAKHTEIGVLFCQLATQRWAVGKFGVKHQSAGRSYTWLTLRKISSAWKASETLVTHSL